MAGDTHEERVPATSNHKELLRAIHHAAYREVVERQFGSWDEHQQDMLFDEDWVACAPFEVILIDGRPAGYCSIHPSTTGIDVYELVLDPGYQGQGIGSRILREVLAVAAQQGRPVRLQALHQNRAAELYRRVGFVEVGTDDTHTMFEWSAA